MNAFPPPNPAPSGDVIPEVPWWPQDGELAPTPWDEDDTALPDLPGPGA